MLLTLYKAAPTSKIAVLIINDPSQLSGAFCRLSQEREAEGEIRQRGEDRGGTDGSELRWPPPTAAGRAQGCRPQLNSNPLSHDGRPMAGEKLPGEGWGRGPSNACAQLGECGVSAPSFSAGSTGWFFGGETAAFPSRRRAERFQRVRLPGVGRVLVGQPVIQPCLWVLWQTGGNRWRGASFSLFLSRRKSVASCAALALLAL